MSICISLQFANFRVFFFCSFQFHLYFLKHKFLLISDKLLSMHCTHNTAKYFINEFVKITYRKRLLVGPPLPRKYHKLIAWQLDVVVGELSRQVRNDVWRGKRWWKRRIHLYGFLSLILGSHRLTDLGNSGPGVVRLKRRATVPDWPSCLYFDLGQLLCLSEPPCSLLQSDMTGLESFGCLSQMWNSVSAVIKASAKVHLDSPHLVP